MDSALLYIYTFLSYIHTCTVKTQYLNIVKVELFNIQKQKFVMVLEKTFRTLMSAHMIVKNAPGLSLPTTARRVTIIVQQFSIL